MRVIEDKPIEGHDHAVLRVDGKRVGFRALDDNIIGLERCPKCHKENYCLAVLAGACAWCGFDLNKGE